MLGPLTSIIILLNTINHGQNPTALVQKIYTLYKQTYVYKLQRKKKELHIHNLHNSLLASCAKGHCCQTYLEFSARFAAVDEICMRLYYSWNL